MVHAKPITQHANWQKHLSATDRVTGGGRNNNCLHFFLPLKTAMSGGGGREFFLKVHRKCLINKGKGT